MNTHTSNFLRNKIRRHRFFLAVISLIGLTWFSFSAWYMITVDFKEEKWTDPHFIVSATLAITLLMSLGFFRKVSHLGDSVAGQNTKEIRKAKKGQQGEEVVRAELEKIFGAETHHRIYPNLQIENQISDCDFVVLSEQGLAVLEVKNYSNKTIFGPEGKLRGHLFKKNPRDQLQNNVKCLRNFLWKNGFNVPIHKALVFVGEKSTWVGKPGVYIVNGVQRLKSFFNFNDRFSAEDYKKLEELLCPEGS